MKKLLILTLSFLLCLNAFTQNQAVIDSLKQVITTTPNDTNKVKLLLQLGYQYENIIPDTALFYYQKALDISKNIKTKKFIAKCLTYIGIVYENQGSYDKAIEYYLKSLNIFKELGNKKGIANCYINIGNIHSMQGSYNKAMKYYLKALKVKKELGDKQGMSNCYNNIGNVYENQSSYDKAIKYYLKSLKIDEELGDKQGMSKCYNNIGNVNYYQGSYDKAIEYFLKSLKIVEKLGNKKGMSDCYSNIGCVHDEQGSYDKAIEYFLKSFKIDEELGNKHGMSKCYNNIGIVYKEQGSNDKVHPVKRDSLFNRANEYYLKSLKIREELGDKNGIANCYNNIGIVCNEQGSYNKAIEYYLKALKIKEELGDKNGIAAIYNNIADLNITLADSSALNDNQRNNYLNKAVEYGKKAIELSKEIEAMQRENFAANMLMKAYKKLGNNKKAMEYAEIYITTKDSMFNKEKTKALTEMQVKYEAEKKQLQIEKMEKQKLLDQKTIEVQQAQNRKQLIIIFSSIAGFIIVLVFSIIILRMFRQKRRANILLAQQNEEIKQQKEEISAQRDLAANQRDLIIEQKKELTDSIHYAYRIQSAAIPSDEYISSILSDYFILYKPRDIVSGDFYWLGKYGNKIVILAADCTGHGVPGAFMSMLGVAFLNEIVNKENITSPADILNKLREDIIKALKQKGKEGESKDGMDVAAITIDTETNKLEYSGANNPLYIVKSKKVKVESEKIDEFEGLTEIKANKQPVAIYIKMEPFINHEINLQKNDIIYIFSDGYADQFGGPKGKKFKYKPFKRLLLENINKPMKKQKEILNKTFEEWKGELEQIDDVLVLGIKI